MNKSFFFNVAIGAIVSFIVSLFVYDITDTYIFVISTVVCTLGLSLIVWLPALYLVGLLCQPIIKLVVIALVYIKLLPGSSVENFRQPTADEQALAIYIRQCRANGMDNGTIRDQLVAVGWDETTAITALRKN